jgi:hypothetical protein
MINNVLLLQIHIASLYCKKHHLSTEAFLELDKKCNFLKFIEQAYEPFHLTGDAGIIEEMERYVAQAGDRDTTLRLLLEWCNRLL